MSKLVTIYGGSGFLGRYIAQRMARAGWRVRVAVRRPNEVGSVRGYGAVGQVEPVLCNIRYPQSVREVMRAADAVINCVGTFDEYGKNNFDAVQDEGAATIARIAAEEGVARLVHISAIGAAAGADSDYLRSKAAGEAGVLEHFPKAVILRPSVMFGPEDLFFNRFASMSRFGPILPIVGGATRFQPVYVDDVAAAAARAAQGKAAQGKAAPGLYELGGPDVETFRDLMVQMLAVIRRRRLVVSLPFWVGSILGFGIGWANWLSLGLVPKLITRDQVSALRVDNVVADGAKGFEAFGIAPTAMEAVLPDYLWRFRPSGQYDAMTESAKNLRSG